MQIRIAGIVPESIVDGPGIRFAIFVQGCPHACKGCHNPHTHDFTAGEILDVGDIIEQIKQSPLIEGITLSGGEPFCQPEACLAIARAAKALGKNIVIYSGYTFEKLITSKENSYNILALLKLTDLLIDGPYIEEHKDLSKSFKGSLNQRVLDISTISAGMTKMP
ncbi:MAG: anaerobic ribonucleoside-triphosphate reductase activating protein [Chlamydiota bacterium]